MMQLISFLLGASAILLIRFAIFFLSFGVKCLLNYLIKSEPWNLMYLIQKTDQIRSFKTQI